MSGDCDRRRRGAGGSVCLEDGGFYIVEMLRGQHCVTHVAAGGTTHDVVRAKVTLD